jgi:hypothetical protein
MRKIERKVEGFTVSMGNSSSSVKLEVPDGVTEVHVHVNISHPNNPTATYHPPAQPVLQQPNIQPAQQYPAPTVMQPPLVHQNSLRHPIIHQHNHQIQYHVPGQMHASESTPASHPQQQQIQAFQLPALNNAQPSRPAYVRIPNPTHFDLLLAASIFHNAASNSNIKYAIVGGLSAQIYGGEDFSARRRTTTFDILIAARHNGNDWVHVKRVLDDLFDRNPTKLNYTLPNKEGHIIVINENIGIPLRAVNSIMNHTNFPNLLRYDGTPYHQNDPESPIAFQLISQVNPPIHLPVLLPRFLLQQRILHFRRPGDANEIDRKENDVADINVYLDVLARMNYRPFTNQEVPILKPKAKEVLQFAELYFIYNGEQDLLKWRWMNIDFQNGEWNN